MKALNKITITGLTVAVAIMFSAFVNPSFAQRAKQGPDPERQERHLQLLKDRLELTDGQVNEIKAIMETNRIEAEKQRLQKEIDFVQKEVTRLSARLRDEAFLTKAPQAVIEKEKQKLYTLNDRLEKLEQQSSRL